MKARLVSWIKSADKMPPTREDVVEEAEDVIKETFFIFDEKNVLNEKTAAKEPLLKVFKEEILELNKPVEDSLNLVKNALKQYGVHSTEYSSASEAYRRMVAANPVVRYLPPETSSILNSFSVFSYTPPSSRPNTPEPADSKGVKASQSEQNSPGV